MECYRAIVSVLIIAGRREKHPTRLEAHEEEEEKVEEEEEEEGSENDKYAADGEQEGYLAPLHASLPGTSSQTDTTKAD